MMSKFLFVANCLIAPFLCAAQTDTLIIEEASLKELPTLEMMKAGDLGDVAMPEAPDDSKETTYTSVEQMPMFPGGDTMLYKFIAKNLIYPAEALENGEEGTVVVRFTVKKDGSITEISIARSRSRALDLEALRVLKMMPKWTPAYNNGREVNCYYTLPIKFKLEE
jgi:TonB family protein